MSQKPPATADTPSADATRADRDLAAAAIRGMYGCGTLDAHRRLDAYSPDVIAQMAEQERIGRRDRIPAILARSPKTRPKTRKKSNTAR